MAEQEEEPPAVELTRRLVEGEDDVELSSNELPRFELLNNKVVKTSVVQWLATESGQPFAHPEEKGFAIFEQWFEWAMEEKESASCDGFAISSRIGAAQARNLKATLSNTWHCFGELFHAVWSKEMDKWRQHCAAMPRGQLPSIANGGLKSAVPESVLNDIKMFEPCTSIGALFKNALQRNVGIVQARSTVLDGQDFDDLITAVAKNHDLARTLLNGKLREGNMLHLLKKIELICRIILLGNKWDHEHVGKKFSQWIPEKFEARIRSLIAGYCRIAKDDDAGGSH